MRLFWYNNFKRHYNNFRTWILWRREKMHLTSTIFPKAGKIEKEDIEWAKRMIEEKRNGQDK